MTNLRMLTNVFLGTLQRTRQFRFDRDMARELINLPHKIDHLLKERAEVKISVPGISYVSPETERFVKIELPNLFAQLEPQITDQIRQHPSRFTRAGSLPLEIMQRYFTMLNRLQQEMEFEISHSIKNLTFLAGIQRLKISVEKVDSDSHPHTFSIRAQEPAQLDEFCKQAAIVCNGKEIGFSLTREPDNSVRFSTNDSKLAEIMQARIRQVNITVSRGRNT